jgi:endonuclease/exonuclease/phosphatase (EEP) superfamily protein YafD
MARPGQGHDLSIDRLALAAVAALWLALLAALLGRFAWIFDLFAHFRAQYAVLFAVLAILLTVRRQRTGAIVASAGALFAAAPLAIHVGLPASPAQAGTGHFRVVSYNVWHRNHDLADIAAWLEQSDADAIVLQELSARRAARLQRMLRSYPHSYVGDDGHGAVIFSRWPLLEKQAVALAPQGVSGSHVVLDWRGARVGLLGVHLHWPMGSGNSRLRNAELAGIAAFASSRTEPLLVAGDLNVSPWSTHFRGAVAGSGLSNCAQDSGLLPTWPAQFLPLGITIDHCLASRQWSRIDVRTGPSLGSDHRALIADLSLAPR